MIVVVVRCTQPPGGFHLVFGFEIFKLGRIDIVDMAISSVGSIVKMMILENCDLRACKYWKNDPCGRPENLNILEIDPFW